MLLGSPRSGTTWLAKILDTHEGVLYLHEPFRKIRDSMPGTALRRVTDGVPIESIERLEVLSELTALQSRCVRPPFFRKSFRTCPPSLLRLAWLAAGTSGLAANLFRRLYDAPAGARYDLLVKEVDWHPGLPQVEGLNPQQLIIIVRHPCAVVYSRLAGIELGVMPEHDRDAWVHLNLERVEAAGYTAREVARMSPWQFYALDWLIENQQYRTLATRHPECTTIVFEELCRDPMRVAGKLFRNLGWEPGEQTRKFISISGSGARSAGLLRRAMPGNSYFGIYRNSEAEANKWHSLLTPSQANEILHVVRSFPLNGCTS
jgi:hypothetical protein